MPDATATAAQETTRVLSIIEVCVLGFEIGVSLVTCDGACKQNCFGKTLREVEYGQDQQSFTNQQFRGGFHETQTSFWAANRLVSVFRDSACRNGGECPGAG